MWIEHDGKGEPRLDPETKVYVRCRDGYESEFAEPFEVYGDSDYDLGPKVPRFWKSWWVHHGDEDDITHYKVVSP